MLRGTTPWSMLVVFATVALTAVGSFLYVAFGSSSPTVGAADEVEDLSAPPSRTALLREKLAQPINLDGGIDPGTPLKSVIDFLAQRYQLTMMIDARSFSAISVDKVEEQPIQLPKMVGVSLATVLRLVLAQVQGDGHRGTYALENDYLLVTTTAHAGNADSWTSDGEQPAPTVDVDFSRRPLASALREIGRASGVNVVLDVRVGEKARRPVTATLTRVPADTAVRLLADMADLRMVMLDNVLYVTSVDNARELQAQQEGRTARRRDARK